MIVLGLLVLLAVGGLALSGCTVRGGAHSPADRGLPCSRLPGPGSGLFFFILVLAATAVSALVSMAAGVGAARHAGGLVRTLRARTPRWPHRVSSAPGGTAQTAITERGSR
jgi:hypothetical protein